MATTTITKIHAVCPHCEQTSESMSHLKLGQQFGPWYCENCGASYNGVYQGVDTVITKDPKGRRAIETLVLLEYPPSELPLRFLMQKQRYEDDSDPDKKSNAAYYFEEHSCPTNWIGKAVVISLGHDPDPHGFLRYVREIDTPELPEDHNEVDNLYYDLFPELINGEPIAPRSPHEVNNPAAFVAIGKIDAVAQVLMLACIAGERAALRAVAGQLLALRPDHPHAQAYLDTYPPIEKLS